jgi:peptidoglycan hydrolase-like protein with peptidoglycan-binding domain
VIDGQLGAMSVAAIKKFQSDRALVVDGHAGSITQAELVKVVKAVQQALGLVVDGDYGSVTVAAVKKHQSSKGLVADGRSGALTMSALGVRRVVGSSSGKLVVIDQMDTGYFSAENCGPTAAVIALVAVGRTPSGYRSTITGNAAVVQTMRVACGLSPAGQFTKKSVSYYGSDLTDLARGIRATQGAASQVTFAAATDAAAAGWTTILHVNHGRLLGVSGANYGHYVVARGKDSSGRILVPDPGRAKRIGIKGYSRATLLNALQRNRGLIVS